MAATVEGVDRPAIRYVTLTERTPLAALDEGLDLSPLARFITGTPVTFTRSDLMEMLERACIAIATISLKAKAQLAVGMGMLIPHITTLGRSGYIDAFIVHPDFRHHGIGQSMMRMLTTEAVRFKLNQLEVVFPAPRPSSMLFLRKAGFESPASGRIYSRTIAANQPGRAA